MTPLVTFVCDSESIFHSVCIFYKLACFSCLTKVQLANLRTCRSTADWCACRRSHRCDATCGSSFAIVIMDGYFHICDKLSCFSCFTEERLANLRICGSNSWLVCLQASTQVRRNLRIFSRSSGQSRAVPMWISRSRNSATWLLISVISCNTITRIVTLTTTNKT